MDDHDLIEGAHARAEQRRRELYGEPEPPRPRSLRDPEPLPAIVALLLIVLGLLAIVYLIGVLA